MGERGAGISLWSCWGEGGGSWVGVVGGVCDDDVLIVHLGQQCCEFVDVHMSSGLGAVCMGCFVEGTLGDEDFALGDVG